MSCLREVVNNKPPRRFDVASERFREREAAELPADNPS